MMGISIEKEKIAQSKSWLPFSTSIHVDFSFFSIDSPIMNKIYNDISEDV